MSPITTPPWEASRTAETRMIEDLWSTRFDRADCYRYNSATNRVRVIDTRFEGMARDGRYDLVEKALRSWTRPTY